MSAQNNQKAPLLPGYNIYYSYYPMGSCCPHYPYYPIPLFEQYQAFIKMYEQVSLKMNGEETKQRNKQIIKEEQSFFPKTQTKLEEKGLSCQCTKSNCLKEYCYCFKNGYACGQKCGCTTCKNHQDQLNEKRHPRREKKVNCKCSKSQCMKKYCECFSAQKKCDDTCGCTGCQN